MYNGYKITLCVPTLNRYVLLEQLIGSAERGSVVPDEYLVIDNGNALKTTFPRTKIFKYGVNIGVAASWNIFISKTHDIRIISNDDIALHENTIKIIVDNFDGKNIIYPGWIDEGSSFSFFCISDEIVNDIGLFDETISPNYAYYEDNDYSRRMVLDGRHKLIPISCGYDHVKSATMKAYTPIERRDHDRKFNLATYNYLRKWGGLPEKEVFTTPYNKGKKDENTP